MVVTFYSFKGGVGRSMALMNVAEILADLGYQVTVCDWDLEAPGLEHYVCDRTEEARAWLAQPGLMDLVAEYKAALANPTAAARSLAEGDPADYDQLGDLPVRRPSSLARVVPPAGSRYRAGDIRFLTAGRRDGKFARQYSEAVSDSDWSEFYSKWAGSTYFEFLRRDLETQGFESSSDETARNANRIVLIDSRTGITEVGGVCTHHLAHLVLLFSAANRQNIAGTETMLQSLRGGGPSGEAAGPSARGCIPVAARIDTLSETSLVTDFLREFKEQFSRYVPAALGNAQDFLQESMIPYAPVFAFKETIVARQPAEQRHPGLFKPYQMLAEAIVRWGKAAGRLKADAPGPEPLTASVSPVQGGASMAPRGVQIIPKGSFYFSWQAADRELAARLAQQLQDAGLEVWSDLLPRKLRPHEPVATQIQAAMENSAGCLILLPRERTGLWLEAELNFALGQQARREDYRVLLLAQDASLRYLPPSLARFPVCTLPPTPDGEAATRILAELLPAQKLVPEPTTSEVIGSLRSPSEQESRFYFGRDEEIDQITGKIERLLAAHQSLLVINGPAGCGKTSMIRAGVLPVFQRGLLKGGHEPWRIVTANPGPANFEDVVRGALAGALGMGDAPVAQIEWKAVLARLGELTQPLLLFVDDAERLFTPTPEFKADMAAMLERFDELQRACREGFFAIAAVRTHSLEAMRSWLGARVTADAYYQMGPLTTEGIRQYFEGAARLLGLDTETGLLELMVSDAVRLGVTGRVLGLLFDRLWQEKRLGGTITHQAYRSFDGLEGLLLESTGQILEKIDLYTHGAAHRLVVSLIHPRTGAPLERSRDDLVSPCLLDPALRRLSLPELRALAGAQKGREQTPTADPANGEALRSLVEAGAVVTTNTGGLRLASPALVQIPLVQQWLAKDMPLLRERADLEDAAQRWEEAGRPAYLLLQGKALRVISPMNVVGQLGFDYYLESLFLDRKYRRRVLMVLIVLGIGFLMSLMFIGVVREKQRAKDEELRRSKEALTKAVEDIRKNLTPRETATPGSVPSPTPQPTPVTSTPPPFATRGLTVEYFAKRADGDRVTEVLGKLGVEFTKRASSASGLATNVIAYGEPVDLGDVLRLARQMVHAGISISSIRPLRGSKQNEPLIQLSSDYNASRRAAYTDEELQAGRIHVQDLKVVPVEVGVMIDHESQEARLTVALDTLRSENYQVEPVEIVTPQNKVTETVVRYFAEKDGEQARHILSDLQRGGVRDGRPSYVLPAQAAGSAPGTFEIWLSAQAFEEEEKK